MKFFKSHFALSRSQQNGIFVLILAIITLQVILIVDFSAEPELDPAETTQVEAFQKELDSLNQVSVINKKDTIYPFNPNYLTDFKGYQLGLSVEEIDRLLAYRAQEKWVNSAREFQEVTGVSDSLLKKISSYFRFPEWVEKRNIYKSEVKDPKTDDVVLDLNSASAEEIKRVNGVGEVLSERIVKYRNSIDGFMDPVQLNDVYGLTPEVISRINLKFKILSKPDRTIKNINSISEAELAEIPYFKADVAKKIISYRKLHEGITSFEELIEIEGFPYDKIDRIKLYLAIE
ncbi:helix-hairpin-helix domain-containing protein [Gramella lutea]|uniref:Helix-hairpin-helix domain-containing protein n=1 Tax=Christiangramia lutea TaxID=1607951 RepID=A0A9X1V2V9_9FLAO|nr:helix-hairpin-helix domain-containing protein [Christiangramia lutea]MCH4823457.1 helix-hairpin-helix domain-containing protein [Christiangramia lutea]